jgi:hypothetical protein
MPPVFATNDEPDEYRVMCERPDRPGEGRWLSRDEAGFIVALVNATSREVEELRKELSDIREARLVQEEELLLLREHRVRWAKMVEALDKDRGELRALVREALETHATPGWHAKARALVTPESGDGGGQERGGP